MDDDLNTPGALDLLFRTIRQANTALDAEDEAAAAPLAAAVRDMCVAFGLALHEREEAGPDDEVLGLANARQEARAAKDWAAADRLRDELRARGWVVEDAAGGFTLRRA
jgi:cysteinyl-tRNA synthetase